MSSHYFSDLRLRTLTEEVENLTSTLRSQDDEVQEIIKGHQQKERALHKLLFLGNKRMRQLEQEVAELKEDKELLMKSKKIKKNE